MVGAMVGAVVGAMVECIEDIPLGSDKSSLPR